MTDTEFLNWLGDRLVHVYGESENVDFVLKVRSLARKAQVEPGPVTAEQKNALKEEGWRAAIDVHSRHGMAGWSSHKDAALSAAQPVAQEAQPVVDQEPASLSHNGSCGSQVSGKPVSAEADRYKRALEAIIANPGGASAKRIATLALGLDGTEQVSAEAKPLPVGWLPNLVDGELLVPTASAEAGKGVGREAYIADLIDTFEQLRQILGTPEQDADALIATVRRLAAPSALPAQAVGEKEAVEPWVDGNGVIRTGVLPDSPQEASKVEPVADGLVTEFENAVSWCTRYHTEYMGKAMPDDVYEKFARLRDETIPRLRAALLANPTKQQQALSDEEIKRIHDEQSCLPDLVGRKEQWPEILRFARAILAAAGGGEK